MTTEQKIIRAKVGLLELANETRYTPLFVLERRYSYSSGQLSGPSTRQRNVFAGLDFFTLSSTLRNTIRSPYRGATQPS